MAEHNPVFYTTITAGQMATHHRDKLIEYIRTRPDGNYEIIIRKPRKKRSLQENAYYWGVIIYMISQETGEDTNRVHEALKIKFLKDHFGDIPSEKLWTVKSTADLNTSEMEEYLANIRQFAAQELNMYIPLPNEVDYERQ